jgi:hypothetical protein
LAELAGALSQFVSDGDASAERISRILDPKARTASIQPPPESVPVLLTEPKPAAKTLVSDAPGSEPVPAPPRLPSLWSHWALRAALAALAVIGLLSLVHALGSRESTPPVTSVALETAPPPAAAPPTPAGPAAVLAPPPGLAAEPAAPREPEKTAISRQTGPAARGPARPAKPAPRPAAPATGDDFGNRK